MQYQIVIPARGGSKRFPKKNVALLGGLPLIAHTILYALSNNLGAGVYVNTDDSEIARIAESFGATITNRPIELAGDLTPTADVLIQQIKYFEEKSIKCDAIILLQATNPFRPDVLLINAKNEFEKSGRNSLTCFSVLNKKYGTITQNRFNPENYHPGQRMQDIEPRYFENGLIYITRKEAILNGTIITEDTYPLIENGIECQIDIDEPSDLYFAEYLISKKK